MMIIGKFSPSLLSALPVCIHLTAHCLNFANQFYLEHVLSCASVLGIAFAYARVCVHACVYVYAYMSPCFVAGGSVLSNISTIYSALILS